jgi:hypothetical protein
MFLYAKPTKEFLHHFFKNRQEQNNVTKKKLELDSLIWRQTGVFGDEDRTN